MLTLGHILAALTGFPADANTRPVVSVVTDSRLVGADSLFVAFVGEQHDGHTFVPEAFARGAAAVLVERPLVGWPVVDCRSGMLPGMEMPAGPVQIWVENTLPALQQLARYWRQLFSVRVTGITGSVGKTTTKELIGAVLSQRYCTLKSEGNQNNEIGLPLTLLRLRPKHAQVVLEMGMYVPGDIRLLCDIARPQVGVLTLVGSVHMERAGSLEALIAGKRELVEALPPYGVAVLNYDEPLVMGMAPFTAARVFTYGLDRRADVWADDIISLGLQGMRFRLHYAGETISVHMPLLGRHNVHTALRAAAVGLIEGLGWDEIATGLREYRDQLRLLVVEGPHGSLILDDTYNASPESTLAALNLLRELDGRRVAVLGDMLELGSAETEGHQIVGRRAAAVADVLIAVGPRARIIGQAALAAGLPPDRLSFAQDVAAAIPLVNDVVGPGDIILIKGSHGARLDRLVTALAQPERQGRLA